MDRAMGFKKILKTIQKYGTFIISTHVNPDPDALSSQLALAAYLRSQGKTAYCINEENIPHRYRFLPDSDQIAKVSFAKKISYDAAIIVDCGDRHRIGDVKKVLDPKKPVVNIDHHVTNDRFGTVNLVQPKASSTAEIVFELLEAARFKMTKKIATLLYLGLMTDTGSFRYENTTSRTHEIAGKLLRFRLPVSDYYQKLYETVPLNDLQYFTKIVGQFESYLDGKVIVMELRQSLLKRFSEEIDLRDKIFRYLRSIKGVEVIVILSEQGRTKTRVNFRSQGRFDVAKLAGQFGGGGHSRASGCVISEKISDAKIKILNDIKKRINSSS